jgi:hypothetical protein
LLLLLLDGLPCVSRLARLQIDGQQKQEKDTVEFRVPVVEYCCVLQPYPNIVDWNRNSLNTTYMHLTFMHGIEQARAQASTEKDWHTEQGWKKTSSQPAAPRAEQMP